MTMESRRSRKGFTLVELMITVAIIGVLASTAITVFRTQQLKSKRTEAMTNLEALAKMQKAHYGEFGIYTTTVAMPAGSLTPSKRQWDAASDTAFGAVGFKIEGGVFYSYDIWGDAPSGACCTGGGCFTAAAYGDVDGDGSTAVIGYFHPKNGTTYCGAQLFPALGPFDPYAGINLFDQPMVTQGSDNF